MIYDLSNPAAPGRVIVDPFDPTRQKRIPEDAEHEDLLVPIFRKGKLVYEEPPLPAMRDRTLAQLGGFHEGHKRFLNPHEYPVGLTPELHELRVKLVVAARSQNVEVEAAP
jgi:nicotinate phosphoribosyltransferase